MRHHGKVQFPPDIAARIEQRAATIPLATLKSAAAALSDAYRGQGHARQANLSPAVRVAAYLAARMPATYAASHAVLSEVRRLGATPIASVLDLGAGAGAASLAARALFPLDTLTLVEPDASLAAAGRELLPGAVWQSADLRHPAPLPPHDLVVAAYALGEVTPAEALAAALRMWQAARTAVVIIEPGSPTGFSLVRAIRARLLEAGAHMLAPCPTGGLCPMRDPDWCHFAARVERSSLHRRLKGAALPYEDEKFSYIALARSPLPTAPARILRRPRHAPGLVSLALCNGSRTTTVDVSRRDRAAFRAARAAAWGEPWQPCPVAN